MIFGWKRGKEHEEEYKQGILFGQSRSLGHWRLCLYLLMEVDWMTDGGFKKELAEVVAIKF